MINRVVLVGRLTKDIEVRKIPSGASTTTFTLACDRRYQGRDNNGPSADFIQCVAWRQSADFLGQYARKGSVVAVDGHITTRNYEGQNGRVYVTEVTCESVRIINGPFEDFAGVVQEISPEKGKMKVSVSMFGRDTLVELEFSQVEKM